MINNSPGTKKGQQLIMPMARSEESPDILNGRTLQAVDLRKDWENILQTINDNKIIQKTILGMIHIRYQLDGIAQISRLI